jgi:acetyl esterase/lipase
MLERRDILAIGAMGGFATAVPVSARKLAAPKRIALWPKAVPGPAPSGLKETFTERSTKLAITDRSLKGVTAPWLEMVTPTKANGAAIISLPGGGYRHLAWDKEAIDIARWLATKGVTSFALAYRLPHDGWDGGPMTPLADAQRAIRLVRSRAKDWGINPNRIAVTGFSAGGHLCANLAAQFGLKAYPPQDEIDTLSARPNLAAPIYPAIMVDKLGAALPAGESLFGKPLSTEQFALHSPHLNVRDDAPPHFLLHAEDDPLVSADHTLALRAALRAKKIPVETHLYAEGGHGFGIRNTKGLPVEGWPERLLAFGKSTGWII